MAIRLKKIMEDSTITLEGYAKLLDISKKTLYNKLVGESDFSFGEYQQLKKIFPQYNVEYLLCDDVTSA